MKVETLCEKIVKIARIALYAIACSFLLWLSFEALILGNKWRSFGEGVGMTLLRVLVLMAAVVVSLCLGGVLEKLFAKNTKLESIVVTCVAAVFGLCNIWWVSKVPYVIDGDQAIIWQNAVLNLQGDFTMFAKGGQMFIYPQQQGLSFLYELLFGLTGSISYKMIGYVNACLAPITMIFGYDVVKMSFGKGAAVRFLPLMLLCLPYTIYAPYVYGDIPSIALTSVLMWAILKALQLGKKWYGVLACIIAALALLCRMNVWIVFIGIVIAVLCHALQQKNWKPLVLAVAVVLSASLCMTGLKAYNASRANEPVSKGMPSVLWMAMGLQYSEWGAGYYNDYSKRTFEEVGFDRELASGIAKTEIKSRIHIFLSDLYQARLFFGQKMKSQWHDSLFDATDATKTFGETQVSDLPKIVASIYHGAGFLTIKQISEYMLCVIYVFALIGVLKRIREKDSLLKDIPLIIFVGGFLFSIIWEAKARYVLPYYVLLHMYAALGLSEVTRGIQNGIFNSKVRKK